MATIGTDKVIADFDVEVTSRTVVFYVFLFSQIYNWGSPTAGRASSCEVSLWHVYMLVTEGGGGG